MASAKRNIRSSVLKSKVTMRALNLALLISFLWNGIVYAGFEFSDMLFRPNMLADKALMDHAKITTPTHRFQTQEGKIKNYSCFKKYLIIVIIHI